MITAVFDGIGSENYQGNGSVTSEVVVYRKSSGGGSGGGGSAKPSEYTVDFEANGAGKVESQTVKKRRYGRETRNTRNGGLCV
ncbi:MAG: hypothetical protein L6V93_10390 [Clostridiales bacterium]|nr:MAG: hypothetical protein L6V93_10390 [Clostridiales bacterium]